MRKSCTPGGSPSVDTFPAFLKRVTETTLPITKVPKTIVLYGGETSTLKFREELRLKVFENMLLRRISGRKGAYSLANRTCNVTLVNQICVVKTGSRAPNEPLVRIRRKSVFLTNTKGCSVQVGTAAWPDLLCTAVCEHLANYVATTEEGSLQLMTYTRQMSFYGIRNILITTKKNLKENAWRDIGCAMGRSAEECKNKTVTLPEREKQRKGNQLNRKR
jgi:hypothetical protein